MDPLDALGCAGCLFDGSGRVLLLLLLLLSLCAALPVGICLLCAGYTLSGAITTLIGAVFLLYVFCRAIRERRLPPDQRVWL